MARRRDGGPTGSAKDRALGLLGVRWRSREELRRRLLQAGFPTDEVELALSDLAQTGLVDDHRFAREVVRDQATRRKAGTRAIMSALRQKGVGTDVAEAALLELPQDDQERALAFASQRASRLTGVAPEAAYRRLLGALLRRGYGPSVARDAARRALREAVDDAAGLEDGA